jgi:cyclase
LKGQGLYKTQKFKVPKYIGDPINSVRIFNEKEVDELIFLDIDATRNSVGPNFELLDRIAGEAFMPMAYGGGLSNVEQVRKVFSLGYEKIVLNSVLYKDLQLANAVSLEFGSQSIVGCIDVKRNIFGKYELYSTNGRKKQKVEIKAHLSNLIESGIGEIFINSLDRDGTMSGYDINLLKLVSQHVSVPVIACGGASSIDDFMLAVVQGGVSAVAAGSMFVFMGKHRAVLINYPDFDVLESALP